MEKPLVFVIGACFMMMLCSGSVYSAEDGKAAASGTYDWVNPDGAGGHVDEAVPPQPHSLRGPYWVNPDGAHGTSDRIDMGTLNVSATGNGYWVNPDGARGTVGRPIPEASAAFSK